MDGIESERSPPAHVAIIMDGNGRWAKMRGLPRVAGHRRGADAVRRAVEAAIELGVSYLTLYGFSSENWKRPAGEVHDLMGLLRHYRAPKSPICTATACACASSASATGSAPTSLR